MHVVVYRLCIVLGLDSLCAPFLALSFNNEGESALCMYRKHIYPFIFSLMTLLPSLMIPYSLLVIIMKSLHVLKTYLAH